MLRGDFVISNINNFLTDLRIVKIIVSKLSIGGIKFDFWVDEFEMLRLDCSDGRKYTVKEGEIYCNNSVMALDDIQ